MPSMPNPKRTVLVVALFATAPVPSVAQPRPVAAETPAQPEEPTRDRATTSAEEAKGSADTAETESRSASEAAKEAEEQAEKALATAKEARSEAEHSSEKADEARAIANTAKKTAEEARLESLRSGAFIQYGVTAGVAFMLETASVGEGTGGARQVSYASTTMPYVLLVPGYWFLGDITREYCATAYGANDALAMQAAADYARRKAASTLTQPEQRAYDREDKDAVEKVQKLADELWNRNQRGRCGWTKVGVWVGKPISYSASVREGNDHPEFKGTVDSSFAFGVAFAPNAYVTALFGGSLNSITVDGTAATPTQPATADELRRIVSLTFGLGGNLDMLGLVFR